MSSSNNEKHTIFPASILSTPAWSSEEYQIVPISSLSDNYSYLIIEKKTNKAAVVDPADVISVQETLDQYKPDLTHILTTHKHWDHAGGNTEFKEKYPDLIVVGGKNEQVQAQTFSVTTGDSVTVGDNMKFEVYEVPCHTTGHVLYKMGNVLFTGDTLFTAGCGKFFEGTAEQMYHNLYDIILSFSPSTLMYCGHEYSTSNLEFAQWLEPNNQAIKDKLTWCLAQRGEKYTCQPTSLKEEREYNPFLRVDSKELLSTLIGAGSERERCEDPKYVLHEVRRMKNENAHKKQ